MTDLSEEGSENSSNAQPVLGMYDTISVTDPQTMGEGRQMYTTYLVTGCKITGSGTRHRYSDFQWLYQRLMIEIPGAFIPTIPHKRTLTMSKDAALGEEFTNTRRINLERFMRGIFEIPELHNQSIRRIQSVAPSLLTFLTTSTGEEFDLAKKQIDPNNTSMDRELSSRSTSQSGSSSGGRRRPGARIGNLFAKAKTVAQTKLGMNVQLETTKEEDEINKLTEYIGELETFMKQLTTASTNLIQSTKDRSTAIQDFVLPMELWKQSREKHMKQAYENGEDDNNTHHNSLFTDMLTTVIKMSHSFMNMLEKQTVDEHNKLIVAGLDRIDCEYFQAIRNALVTRRDLQIQYTTRTQQINAKKEALEKSNDGFGKLQNELTEMKRLALVERHKLEETSERIIREKNRVLPAIEKALQNCIMDYAEIQSEYSNIMGEAWLILMENDNK